MSKSVAYCTLIVAAALVVVLAASAPAVLDDSNLFLKDFINSGLLDVLGVILAITLASAGQLHLTLNQTEERHGKVIFLKARGGVKSATYMLIALFLFAVVLVVAKPLLAGTAAWAQALFNGAALFVVLWNVLLLLSLTQGIFGIKADLTPPGR